jgi:hypothetical protein
MFTGARLLRFDYCEYPPSVLFETDILVDNLFTFLGGRLDARLGWCECVVPGIEDPTKLVDSTSSPLVANCKEILFSSSLSRISANLFSETFLCLRPTGWWGTGGLFPKFYWRELLVGPLECYCSAEGALLATLNPESLPALNRESWLYLLTLPVSLNWRPLYSDGGFLLREALELILLIMFGSPLDTILAPTAERPPLLPLLSLMLLFLDPAEYLGWGFIEAPVLYELPTRAWEIRSSLILPAQLASWVTLYAFPWYIFLVSTGGVLEVPSSRALHWATIAWAPDIYLACFIFSNISDLNLNT